MGAMSIRLAIGTSTAGHDRRSAVRVDERLRGDDEAERLRLLTILLREARDVDVWEFVTPREVADVLPRVASHLGRRRAFCEFLIEGWRSDGTSSIDKLTPPQRDLLEAFFAREHRGRSVARLLRRARHAFAARGRIVKASLTLAQGPTCTVPARISSVRRVWTRPTRRLRRLTPAVETHPAARCRSRT
jgi:hypothetical protein